MLFHIRNKADSTENLDTDKIHKGGLSISAHLANLISTNITKSPIHYFFDIWNAPFNFEELIFKVSVIEWDTLENSIQDIVVLKCYH